MKERNWLRRFMQYGYDTDVFDKYRDAVARYNRSALTVLGGAGTLTGLAALIVMLARRSVSGLPFALLLLLAGIGGVVIVRQKGRKLDRRIVQAAGYLLCIAFYALAIYGNASLGMTAFWVGVNMAMSCYLLYYSTHLLGLQAASYIVLLIAMDRSVQQFDTKRIVACAVFLLAGMITSFALGRARLGLIMSREVTRKQADTDLLTGLMIRNAAQLDIEQHLASGSESGVLMLLDLDRFKSVNDKLGHQMGDKVLIDVAASMKKMFRNTDVLSRLGGDEFIIYMKGVPEKDWAAQRAEQVMREVRRWIGDGTTNIQVTASVGVVMTDMVERTYEELYRAADIAMYFAKARGGNQAVFYSRDLLTQARETAAAREDGKAQAAAEHKGTGEELR